MINQLADKEATIKSTNGGVLNHAKNSAGANLNHIGTLSYYGTIWMQSVIDYSPEMHSIYGGIIGQVLNPYNIEGSPDNQNAEMDSFNWNLNPNDPLGGEAIIYGDMGQYLESAAIYITGKAGPYTGQNPPGAQYWHNYVNVWVSEYSNGPWNWIGYAGITQQTASDYYIGNVWDSYYQYIAICTWYPPPYPTYCDPDPASVLVDGVSAWHW